MNYDHYIGILSLVTRTVFEPYEVNGPEARLGFEVQQPHDEAIDDRHALVRLQWARHVAGLDVLLLRQNVMNI